MEDMIHSIQVRIMLLFLKSSFHLKFIYFQCNIIQDFNDYIESVAERPLMSISTEELVDRFCTPPPTPDEDNGIKTNDAAEIREIPFEGYPLCTYAWGSGDPVLLVHGWGSRAVHMSALAWALTRSGFRVITFDGPAHGRSLQTVHRPRSSMFAFCRAIAAMDRDFGPFHGIAAHSMGAAAAVFTAVGHGHLANFKINTKKLVLINCPANVARMVERFCRNTGLNPVQEKRLLAGLEASFHFVASDYQVDEAMKKLDTEVLIVHDAQDEEIPVADAEKLKTARKDITLVLTNGAGHMKILANRTMIKSVRDFFLNSNRQA